MSDRAWCLWLCFVVRCCVPYSAPRWLEACSVAGPRGLASHCDPEPWSVSLCGAWPLDISARSHSSLVVVQPSGIAAAAELEVRRLSSEVQQLAGSSQRQRQQAQLAALRLLLNGVRRRLQRRGWSLWHLFCSRTVKSDGDAASTRWQITDAVSGAWGCGVCTVTCVHTCVDGVWCHDVVTRRKLGSSRRWSRSSRRCARLLHFALVCPCGRAPVLHIATPG
jgi:hypothetical protein